MFPKSDFGKIVALSMLVGLAKSVVKAVRLHGVPEPTIIHNHYPLPEEIVEKVKNIVWGDEQKADVQKTINEVDKAYEETFGGEVPLSAFEGENHGEPKESGDIMSPPRRVSTELK